MESDFETADAIYGAGSIEKPVREQVCSTCQCIMRSVVAQHIPVSDKCTCCALAESEVTKRRTLEAQCAALREVVESVTCVCPTIAKEQPELRCRRCVALATDAGKGWVSPGFLQLIVANMRELATDGTPKKDALEFLAQTLEARIKEQ